MACRELARERERLSEHSEILDALGVLERGLEHLMSGVPGRPPAEDRVVNRQSHVVVIPEGPPRTHDVLDKDAIASAEMGVPSISANRICRWIDLNAFAVADRSSSDIG